MVTAQNNLTGPQNHAIIEIQSCQSAHFFSVSAILRSLNGAGSKTLWRQDTGNFWNSDSIILMF